ncbi:hypothetical protein PN466_04280 [Roseofilum reptotaenium CS-1145]|uniref:Uncharacterized protein n=1 Tax=Roseofilum reptotaenium AO1-A TaxID=1925591 RepID=A0A1L9QXG7_9CYAN|nr:MULTISPECIES: hypothetical protein [Roseofilum]MBP0029656.1 hypothetical protein [Roseofilum sp. Guam]MDB9516175.1 hypothetical protein [Roseofilum reptotaenium CS-1145]OJJ27353.1 hypothetical protein BI308_02405 [Roseofilum reptotaenium AO1-A]
MQRQLLSITTLLFSLTTCLPLKAQTLPSEQQFSPQTIRARLETIDTTPKTAEYYEGFNEGFNEGFEAGLAAKKANQPNQNNYQMLMNSNPRPLIQGWAEGYVKGYEEGYEYGDPIR